MSKHFDLVMWTYNSAGTLPSCLRSLRAAIPEEKICHKIIVDGGSQDSTARIAKEFGWDFHVSNKRGIPYQANLALEKVDTELYASFEHDIVLAKDWLPRMEKLMDDPDVAVAQGMRITKGSKPLEAIDKWMFDRDRIAKWYYSIDNNLYKTDAVKAVGGYPFDCRYSVDGLLRNEVFKHGWKWVVDNSCWSYHLRGSYGSHLRHLVRVFSESNVFWEVATESDRQRVITLFGAPIRGAQIAAETATPSVFLAYPLMRYVKMMAEYFNRENKTVLKISLDDYYKEQLSSLMMQNARPTTGGMCVYCGAKATIERETPWGFGNLNKVFGKVMRFCSEKCVDLTVDYVSHRLYSQMRETETHGVPVSKNNRQLATPKLNI